MTPLNSGKHSLAEMIVHLFAFGSWVSYCFSFVHMAPYVETYLFAETQRGRTIHAFRSNSNDRGLSLKQNQSDLFIQKLQ